ncbi:MAG: TonB-dependent receptor [Rhizomicrobium sp.]|nr:TonB-dependent receptor [Rhizomicrobium sp.]
MTSRLQHGLIWICGFAAVLGETAFAQTRAIDIPSAEASKSIPEFARQAQIQIVAPVSQLHGIKTPAVAGTMDIGKALQELLVGTGLEIASSDSATIILRMPAAPTNENHAANPPPKRATPVFAMESVVITGSLIIGDLAKSPTPITVVRPEEIAPTTPSNIPDGLNKLPIFQGSAQPRSPGNGSTAGGINVLNLRNFGAYRTLVLLDGRRVTPSNADGTVVVDTLPQVLVSRVDIVTGGASAVYGSDAVTGVVNFILDKSFSGLKTEVDSGLSSAADGASAKLSIAAGSDILAGRGHIEGSLLHFQEDGVRIFDRSYGPKVYVATGVGTQANPFVITINTRRSDSTFGGRIACSICSVNGYQFGAGGAIFSFSEGTATGTGSQQSGGDGAYSPYSSAQTNVRTNSAFGRFSYDFLGDTNFYIQATVAEQFSSGWWFPTKLTASPSYPAVFFKNNAFLSPTAQTLLGNSSTTDQSNTFVLGEYMNLGPYRLVGTRSVNRNITGSTGLQGSLLERFRWEIFYSHGENRQAVSNLNNTNYQKLYAAEDAVATPDGSIKCYAATQTVTTGTYGDCVPLNPFGLGSITPAAYAYFTGTTWYHMTNYLDDLGGSIMGTVFHNWAGDVQFALSSELRFLQYKIDSNASPTATVNCAGLRNCNPSLILWAQNTVAPMHASNFVWELAGELNIPLVRGKPLVQRLDLDLAGRYTDYSTSGPVQTWKVGADYQVNNDLRLRATTSIDIRAPTLNDLFSPPQETVTSFVDVHTSSSGTLFVETRGNPNLVPEVARTYTAGIVLTPDVVPGLMLSLDYYGIRLKNGIAEVSGQNFTIQRLCENSNGASPYCALITRPLAYSNTTAANFPSLVYSENLNTALTEIEGFDFEANDSFEVTDVVADWTGLWATRLLANYQPVNQTQQYAGAIMTYLGPGPDTQQTWKLAKTHATLFLSYARESWVWRLQDRWIGGYSKVSQAGQVWVNPHVRSTNYVDLNIERQSYISGLDVVFNLSAQNLFNAQPGLYPFSGSVGLVYPVAPEQDIMGRYITLGVRASL